MSSDVLSEAPELIVMTGVLLLAGGTGFAQEIVSWARLHTAMEK